MTRMCVRWPIEVFWAVVAILTLPSTQAVANPASPDPVWVQQPGGQAFVAYIRGDEHQGWVETREGYTVMRRESTGPWEYAARKADGTLIPSGTMVKPGFVPPLGTPAHLAPARAFQAADVTSTVGYIEPMPISGPKNMLIILVNFADRSLVTTGDTWNTTTFSTTPGQKSVANFYNDNSFGIMTLQPVPHTQPDNPPGIVTVTLPQNHPNCAKTFDYTVESAWVNSALSAASAYVDFAVLDADGNGILEPSEVSIYFILAGYDASGSTKTPNIWAHAWGGSGVSVQGKQVRQWALNGELNDSGVQHPIGIICHELGHSLCGLPDLYDTSFTNMGLGVFSVMSYGSWGHTATDAYSGTTPVGMDAWCRQYLGWSTPRTNPIGLCSFSPSLSARDTTVKLAQSGTTEYFLIENRCSSGWDQGMEGTIGTWTGALAILHVDSSIWSNAYVDGRHQGVMLEEASPDCISIGCLTDLFYSGNNSNFTDVSVPDSRLYSGASTDFCVTDISAPDLTMTANIYVQPSAPTNISATPMIIWTGDSSTLSANVGVDEIVDWYAGSCGEQLVGSGTVRVNPTETTTYYARARNLTSGRVGGACTSVTVICLGSQNTIVAAAGSLYSAALRGDGTAWAWGNNDYGQIGDGTSISRPFPVNASGLNNVVGLSARSTHTVALTSDGVVWTWGDNSNGQLGDGTTYQRLVPAPVTELSGVVAVAAGAGYTVALRNDGTVWAWGANASGQLGDGTTTDYLSPKQVPGLSAVIGIAAGNSHTVALKSDGTVVAWGLNNNGQLGNGSTINSLSPVPVSSLTSVKSIVAGGNHTLAVMNDGTLRAWGANSRGQLGNGYTYQENSPVSVAGFSGVSAVAASDLHTIAVKNDGTVWNWGDNTYGELAINTTTTYRLVPCQVTGVSNAVAVAAGNAQSSAHSVVVKSDGTVQAWGSNSNSQLGNGAAVKQLLPVKVPGISGVTSIGGGSASLFTIASRSDGTALSWGENATGQLGDGSLTSKSTPVSVLNLSSVANVTAGGNNSVAVKNDGTVWAWGWNNIYRMRVSRPAQVAGMAGAVRAAAGYDHTVALMLDGTLRTWGNNSDGELGNGTRNYTIAPIQPTGLSAITSIAAGTRLTMALKDDGTVWAWGNNSYGQLGSGSTNPCLPAQVSGLSDVRSIAVGLYHATSLKNDGTVWSWGANTQGLLGNGTTDSEVHPTPAQVPGLNNVIAISDGGDHVLALKGDGTVWAWGDNSAGQLGDGTVTTQYVPVQVACLPRTVTGVATGYGSSFALKSDGTVWAWGNNSSGQIGNGYAAVNPLPVTAVFDTGSPTGAININNGAIYATSPSVALSLSASDDSETIADMRISDDGVIDTKPWEPFITTRAWTLSGADGFKTIYAQFRDPTGNVSDVASASIVLDTLPPVIQSAVLLPPMAASGDIVQVRVIATDGSGVASVDADGVALALTEGVWTGQLIAASPIGDHVVIVKASDAAGLLASDSKGYKTARVYGVACRNAAAPIMANACQNMLFKFWGKVTSSDSDSFSLSDGSGYWVRVVAPGYAGIGFGDYVSARGILDPSTTPPTLNAPAASVVKLN